MSNDPLKKEIKNSISAVKYYSSMLAKIKGSREYYSWFDQRLSSINDVLPEYSLFVREFNKIETRKIDEIPKEFVGSFLNIANYFSRFYHVKSIYETCETGKISPYFVDNLQFNVMIRFFNFINKDPTKILIPPPYDLQFTEKTIGFYTEDAEYSSALLQITNEYLANPMYDMVFLTIRIYYFEGIPHQNLLVFNKSTREVYLVEPSLEMDLKPGKTQSSKIDTFTQVITEYTRIYFSNYTFKGLFRTDQCSLPYHGGFCAPLSFVLILRPDITSYNAFVRLIKSFVDQVMQEINQFYSLLQHGIRNPTAIARYPTPSTFTEDFDAYIPPDDYDPSKEFEFEDSEEPEVMSNFGNGDIKYLKKLISRSLS
jgi:hypothetical protein